MTDPVISGDGAEQQPSATPTESATTPSMDTEEAELDAKVRENLGQHYIPVDSATDEPETKQPETEKQTESEQKPDEGDVQNPEETVETPPIPKPESRASRLDKRVATLYVQNLLLSGEKTVPPLDELVEELREYPMDQKVQALREHLRRNKELRGVKPTEEFEPEDIESIRDAERESIRSEVIAEENERKVKQSFVEFIGEHPELDESKPEYRPTFARAVETLWRGGMPIQTAFETVTSEIDSIKNEELKKKQEALSGAVSASGGSGEGKNELSWEDMARLQLEDPVEYERLVRSGYTPKS